MTSTSPTTNASSEASFGWPVQVFRHTQARGWEKAINNVVVLATPCIGGVEIRQFRVRIRVFPKKEATTSTASRCTKRRNLLFLSAKSQSGSIVFSFRNEAACNEFFDELLDLNGRKQQVEHDKKPAAVANDDAIVAAESTEEAQRRKQDTLSYLARLLQDKDFGHFVQNMEESLTSSEDGAKMLAAFQTMGTDGEDSSS